MENRSPKGIKEERLVMSKDWCRAVAKQVHGRRRRWMVVGIGWRPDLDVTKIVINRHVQDSTRDYYTCPRLGHKHLTPAYYYLAHSFRSPTFLVVGIQVQCHWSAANPFRLYKLLTQ